MKQTKHITIVVPVYNEAENVPRLLTAVSEATMPLPQSFSFLFVDDGSTDGSADLLDDLATKADNVEVVHFSRNFGKEVALTAGLQQAQGDAVLLMDADLQHPPQFIPEFVENWEKGADVVVGMRSESAKDSYSGEMASKLYYKIMTRISSVPIVPNATDFRLLDRQVVDAFNRFGESNRMVRGLIDWLGFDRAYVVYPEARRHAGQVSYSRSKLIQLAISSFVSMSLVPLKLSMWLGAFIVILSGPLGLFILLDVVFLGNSLRFSGPASLGVLILFLVGIILITIGFLGLYIANINSQVSDRPLYIVKKPRKH